MAALSFACFLGMFLVIQRVQQSEADYCFCEEFEPRGANTICKNVSNLITTASGAPVDDKENSMTAGRRGPIVLEDSVLMEEHAHFDREKVPARVIHANGGGAWGYFTVTDITIKKYCKASLFEYVGKETKIMVRFSTQVREAGSCDTVRDLKGAAIKFYSDDGNWDLTCFNAPMFVANDPSLSIGFFRSWKRDSVTHLPNHTSRWDYATLQPEASLLILWLFTNRAIPDGYRHMAFHAIHTFTCVNDNDERFFVKFHFKPDLGEKYMNASYAITTCASDFDYNKRDLFNSILNHSYPNWTMEFQVMSVEEAQSCSWDPFDITKVWPEEDYPYYEIGKIVLDRNPVNYFAEIEQAAFSPSNLPPGIEPCFYDTLFQARMFAYPDAQRYRIGVNYQQLPVNCPIVKVKNHQRDGFMAIDNQAGEPIYYPNSFQQNVCPEAGWTKWSVCGEVGRYEIDNEDNYDHTRLLWDSLDSDEKEEVITNLCESITQAFPIIQKRAITVFSEIDNDLGTSLSECLVSYGLDTTSLDTCSE